MSDESTKEAGHRPAEDRYENTTFRRCGRSGLLLPPISLGFWHNFGHDQDLDTQRAIVRRAVDLGVTHLDLANNYGPSPGSAEENLGCTSGSRTTRPSGPGRRPGSSRISAHRC